MGTTGFIPLSDPSVRSHLIPTSIRLQSVIEMEEVPIVVWEEQIVKRTDVDTLWSLSATSR